MNLHTKFEPNLSSAFREVTGQAPFVMLMSFLNQPITDVHPKKSTNHSANHIVTDSTTTRRGLLAPKRLCYGVKTAPSLFQSTMDQILTGVDNVFCYIDDILIATETVEEHVKVTKVKFTNHTKS
jgi:hypothetical protein